MRNKLFLLFAFFSIASINAQSVSYSNVFNGKGEELEKTSCLATSARDQLTDRLTFKYKIYSAGTSSLNEIILV